MLGLIHRATLGKGPVQFMEFFKFQPVGVHLAGRENHRRHSRQLVSHRIGKFLDILSHSALGLCDVYNLLPEYIVEAANVSEFQARLQEMMKCAATSNYNEWKEMLSPRILTHRHPLRQWMGWCPEKLFVRQVNKEGNAVSACASWLRFQAGLT